MGMGWNGVLGAATAFLASTGGAVSGPCPGPGDLTTGIVAEFADGRGVEYRDAGEGLVEIFEPGAPGSADGILFLSLIGLYDLEAVALEGGHTDPDRWLSMRYPQGVDTLPVPEPGEAWVGAMETEFPDGGVGVDTAVYVFGRAGLRELGGCSYDTISVTASFVGPQNWVAQDFVYFTGLGIAVLTARREKDAEPSNARVLAALHVLAP